MYDKIIRALACLAVVLTLAFAASAQANGQGYGGMQGSQSPSQGSQGQMQGMHGSMGSNTMGRSEMGPLDPSDRQFVMKAAQGGQAEVELGQLAEQKSQDPKVKEFAKRMVNDHSQANQKLQSIAGSKGINLPSSADKKEKAEKDRLSKLSGEQFDRAYMEHMVRDHKKDVAEFQHEATSTQDPDIKSFASGTLPTLQDHLKQAESITPQR
ncbi:MAG: DUF4142 domain-containing protein [Terriglobales bacterium]